MLLLIDQYTLPPLTTAVIMVDNTSMEELEREVAAAERKVLEARKLACQLKWQVKVARSLSFC